MWVLFLSLLLVFCFGCCTKSRNYHIGGEENVKHSRNDDVIAPPNLVFIGGGVFVMGSDDAPYEGDGESPVERRTVDPFYIGETEVTVKEFRSFVKSSNYKTDAERFGWSFVFDGFLTEEEKKANSNIVVDAPWFAQTYNVTFEMPFGPIGGKLANDTDPVVQVSWNDAANFCHWHGMRLPTEIEWEFAASSGRHATYPWGDVFKEKGKPFRANIWTGQFPKRNNMRDGFFGAAPVKSFEPNDFGLYEMVGNVWEWVYDDWSVDHSSRATDPSRAYEMSKERLDTMKTEKGGSFLCHKSYCFRYRNSARTASTADSSSNHIGFRCAKSVSFE